MKPPKAVVSLDYGGGGEVVTNVCFNFERVIRMKV